MAVRVSISQSCAGGIAPRGKNHAEGHQKKAMTLVAGKRFHLGSKLTRMRLVPMRNSAPFCSIAARTRSSS